MAQHPGRVADEAPINNWGAQERAPIISVSGLLTAPLAPAQGRQSPTLGRAIGAQRTEPVWPSRLNHGGLRLRLSPRQLRRWLLLHESFWPRLEVDAAADIIALVRRGGHITPAETVPDDSDDSYNRFIHLRGNSINDT